MVVRLEALVKQHVIATPSWATASYGNKAETSPMEISALGQHLNLCKNLHGRMFAIHCAADRMHGFLAPRFITTLFAVALLIGIAFLVL